MTPSATGTRAVALAAPGSIAVVRRPDPDRAPGEALVRIEASGVCGTDVAIFRGEPPVEAGRVLGHEAVGVVVEMPEGSALEAGARVAIDPTIACWSCPLCREGLPNLCSRAGLLGRELDGVFADLVSVPVANLHPLPDAVLSPDAPLVQVLATVVHAQERVHVVPGRLAAVVGLGCTGQLHAQLLSARGARVLGVTRSEAKLELAARLSSEWTAQPGDAPALAAELDPRGGADLVVECAGTLESLACALAVVRPGGTILAYGVQTATEGRLPFYALYKKEVTLISARANLPRDFEIAIGLVATGRVLLAPLISDRLPLDEAERALVRSAEGALKVVMTH